MADLSGDQLRAALEGGVDVLKVSHDQLMENGRITDDDQDRVLEAMSQLRADGAVNVVVSRADQPTLALVDDTTVKVIVPPLQPVDTRGGGDSMTAGLATALARGHGLEDALCLAAAAAALNVTRRGLATGDRQQHRTNGRPGGVAPAIAARRPREILHSSSTSLSASTMRPGCIIYTRASTRLGSTTASRTKGWPRKRRCRGAGGCQRRPSRSLISGGDRGPVHVPR